MIQSILDKASDALPRLRAQSRTLLLLLLAALVAYAHVLQAQSAPMTGPQQLAFAGLRALSTQGVPAGQINAVLCDANSNLFLLIDQKDGVRVLKVDPTGSSVLAQAQLGAKGDIGTAMALDPAGNVYVTGTTSSGALTATAGAAFTTPSGTATNAFVAKFDANLNTYFVTFAGAGYMSASGIAATPDAVFITGPIFSATLPVTSGGIIQKPAYGATGNGFVEKFSSSGTTLLYATYLSGAGGSTSSTAIVADGSDSAYIAGYTSAPGYPTLNALVPEILGSTSGFLTRLTAAGDGILFSTFLPGDGITSLALDPASGNLLVSGSISLGQFPVATLEAPPVPLAYQVLLRLSADGSSVLSSTALAPGGASFVTSGPAGTAWVDGSLSLPLFPLTPLSSFGNSFAEHITATGVADQTARFGGVPASNAANASAPVNLTSVAVDPTGAALFGGGFAPGASSSLLATQTFDLPLESAPTTAFPSTVHEAVLPPSACSGSLCPGAAAYLAKLLTPSSPSAALALSVDTAPTLTLRNLGSAEANGLQITVSGFTQTTNCGTTLPAGAECFIALSGTGPGSITASATNAATQTQALPALSSSASPSTIVFSPRELDFGVVSAAGAAATRTISVTNLSPQVQTFSSAFVTSPYMTHPYSVTEESTDCTLAGGTTRSLLPGATCHIILSLAAAADPSSDGPIQAAWQIGTDTVALTAYGQAAALSLSAARIDFGTQYVNGLHLPRYLYLANASTNIYTHAALTLPVTSPFTITDRCPSVLEPHSICQMELTYHSAASPSADATTLTLDQGLSVLVDGRTVSPPSANSTSANPNLSVSSTSVLFATPVPVTSTSSASQSLTVRNTGGSALALALVVTGDFSDSTDCPVTLVAGASCSVVLTFAPGAPGARQGLLALTAGAGTAPVYVSLSGMGTAILSPATNGTFDFGSSLVGEPVTEWYKVSQSFTQFSAAIASSGPGAPFSAVLVEDIGYGHGEPAPSAFGTAVSGTCYNCWVGIRFDPPTASPAAGTLTLTSSPSGSPYVLSLTGTGEPLSGLLLSPVAQDFGPVPVHSTSTTQLFVLTNLSQDKSAVTVSSPSTSGDFALSPAATAGQPCGGTLAYTASCTLQVTFAPTTTGPATGTLSVQASGLSASAALSGYGETDPGIALSPAAVVFHNVPGPSETEQTVTVTNTGNAQVQVGAATIAAASSATAFTASSSCGALAIGASCTVQITYLPSDAPASATLELPVTSTNGGANSAATYTLPLTSAYTSEDAGLAIVPGEVQYGPLATGSSGPARQFTIDNLSGKALTLQISLPRHFVLQGAPCAALAAGTSCTFSVAFLPLTNGSLTGTIFSIGSPTDGSATVDGLSYVVGYGTGSGSLTVTGSLSPSNVLSFGQVPSGQSVQKTLTLTNTSSVYPLTIRRLTTEWPFLAMTTCGATLAPAASCTVTVTYSPLNQVSSNITVPPTQADSGTLVIESDAASSPELVDLSGTATPTSVASPSNVPGIAAFLASQSSLTFPTTQAGDSSPTQSVVLSNTGTAPVHIFNLLSSPDYSVSSDCGAILPGASCTLNVAFTPQPASPSAASTTTRPSAIEISSDALTPLEFVSVVGSASPSSLVLSQSSVDFGSVQVNSKATLSLALTNTGSTSITFGALSATGDFSVTAGSCPLPGLALPAATSCTLQLVFDPTQTGVRNGSVEIVSSASTLPLAAALTGGGVQSHLQVAPAALDFGSVALNTPSSLSFTLANTGTAPITGIKLSATSGYSVSAPCAVSTLAAGASCPVTITFNPQSSGPDPGTLTILSFDASSPTTLLLTGTGISSGTFTLTAEGGASASSSVHSGGAASTTLTLTPIGGFSGTVVLNCTPLAPAEYAFCSLLPSSLTLNGAPQNTVATITTVTSVALQPMQQPPGAGERSFGQTALALLFPAMLFSWKARMSRRRAWRQIMPFAWAVFATSALLSSSGCGGGSDPNLRFASPGTYQYQVTASSVGAPVQITQRVTINLTVTQ